MTKKLFCFTILVLFGCGNDNHDYYELMATKYLEHEIIFSVPVEDELGNVCGFHLLSNSVVFVNYYLTDTVAGNIDYEEYLKGLIHGKIDLHDCYISIEPPIYKFDSTIYDSLSNSDNNYYFIKDKKIIFNKGLTDNEKYNIVFYLVRNFEFITQDCYSGSFYII